ncbi:MAG: hypothetical protein HYU66_20570, partial [Armatimonadetes bacterium]|nr:hypothetical protein [Armatimonadota bacterium]
PGAVLALWALDAGQPETLSADAGSPCWSADGSLLAWIDGPEASGVAYLREGATHRFVLHSGRFSGLAVGPRGVIYGTVPGAATGVAQLDPATGGFTWLSRSGGEASGAPLISPDGCYVAAALAGGTVLVVEADGSWEAVVTGSLPHWLPLPAARAWTGRPVLP